MPLMLLLFFAAKMHYDSRRLLSHFDFIIAVSRICWLR